MKCIVTVAVSASGKSTWARAWVQARAAEGQIWAILCNDDMRLAILRESGVSEDGLSAALGKWNYSAWHPLEARAKAMWIQELRRAIERRVDGVVCADTNLDGGAYERSVLLECGARPDLISTRAMPIDLELAIERDSKRLYRVGEPEVRRQFGLLSALLAEGWAPDATGQGLLS